MKKILLFTCTSLIVAACNDSGTVASHSKSAADSPAAKIEYAYLPANHPPDNWEKGDQKNVALVLNSFKGMEKGDAEAALEPFADSVHWLSDGVDRMISKDSLRSMVKQYIGSGITIKFIMDDYESVISKDKKDEWVTLWYKQIETDKSGKVDSLAIVDDVKIVNGKIVELDEKQRKYPAIKKK